MINLIHYTRHLNMRFRIDRIKDMVVDVDLSGALILSFTVFLINTTPSHQVKAFVHDLDKGLKKLQAQ